MTKRLTAFFVQLVQSYLFLMFAALAVGLLLPHYAIVLAPFATLALQAIFFLTSLKMDARAVLGAAKNIKMIVSANVFMLVLLPSAVFLIANALVPEMAIALLLLASMPTGMTAPLLTEVAGGKTDIALVLTLTTSLLAPFTVPFVIDLFAGTAVTVSVWTMFWSLIKVIVVPFVLAQGVRAVANGRIVRIAPTFKPISLFLLCLLIAGVVAKQADVILAGFGQTVVLQFVVLFVFIALLLVLGYFVAFWRHCTERVTVSICMTFMNFTLAIYLAGSFFADPNVLLASVLVIFPWALLLLPFRAIAKRLVCKVL